MYFCTGALSVGLKRLIPASLAITPVQPIPNSCREFPRETISPPPVEAKRKKNAESILRQAETDDTLLLSTTALQRLVLLEQLKLITLKQEAMRNPSNSDTPQFVSVIFDPDNSGVPVIE